jgi:chromosome segregation ATPase
MKQLTERDLELQKRIADCSDNVSSVQGSLLVTESEIVAAEAACKDLELRLNNVRAQLESVPSQYDAQIVSEATIR